MFVGRQWDVLVSWMFSGVCLKGVLRLSGGCLEAVYLNYTHKIEWRTGNMYIGNLLGSDPKWMTSWSTFLQGCQPEDQPEISNINWYISLVCTSIHFGYKMFYI